MFKKNIPVLDAKKAKGDIFSDSEFSDSLSAIATDKKISLETARSLCSVYFDEIAAQSTQNKLFWNAMELFVRKNIIQKFDTIYYNKDALEVIKKQHGKSSVVLVPNHRSTFDFMILPYIVVKETSYAPMILAADLFTAFPVGPLFRRMGAYFVCRESPDLLYSLVFKYYVMQIVRHRLLHLFFIEGGRNKSGGYSPPKIGMLKYILDGVKKYNPSDDVLFLPVNITYDIVPESSVVLQEHQSGKRKHIFKSLRYYFFKKKSGNCYLSFGRPRTLQHYLKQYSEKKAIQQLACTLSEDIKSLVTITPTALLCYVLLTTGNQTLSEQECQELYTKKIALIRKKNQSQIFPAPASYASVFKFLCTQKIVAYTPSAGITIPQESGEWMNYYASNIRHIFEEE